jgi:chemotaxis protein MotB
MIGDAPNRRQRRIVPVGAPPWMATFADLATLLLSFFVLLLSFSEMDVEKYKQIAGSMREAFGVQRVEFARDTPRGTSVVMREFSPGRPDPSELMIRQESTDEVPQIYLDVLREGVPLAAEDAASDGTPMTLQGQPDEVALSEAERQALENLVRVREILDDEIERGLVEVERQGSRIIIRIRERGSFPSGSAELIEPFTPVIRKIGEALALTDGKVVIAGHTDDVPISTPRFRSNWELSAARAVTLLLRLRELSDLDETRVTVEGHADTRPLAPNDSVLNRARNRRVEVILVHGEAAERALSVEQLLPPEEPADG